MACSSRRIVDLTVWTYSLRSSLGYPSAYNVFICLMIRSFPLCGLPNNTSLVSLRSEAASSSRLRSIASERIAAAASR